MKYFFTIILYAVITSSLVAQTAADAFRYSTQDIRGTARYLGVGGAMGALGTDYSVLSSNPAGLAVYRKSEFVLTPSLSSNKTTAQLVGTDNEAFDSPKNKFRLNSVGLVFNNKPRSAKWKTLNFAIGYNKIATYDQEFSYEGSTSGSMAESYAEAANGLTNAQLDAFSTGLAYETGAIFSQGGASTYGTDFSGSANVPVRRTENITTTGGINELIFSLASNYNNRLMFGLTLGVPFLDWKQDRVYREEDSASDDIPFFNYLSYEEEIGTAGIGINAKFGLIYRFNQMLRLGLAVHSPTRFGLTDSFQSNLTYSFTESSNSGGVFTANSPDGSFNYRLRTPWRYLLSGAVLIKKFGFVSAEIEYTDFGTAAFNFQKDNPTVNFSASENQVNTTITDTYQSSLNFKLGAEYVYDKFQFRAGYNINGSAFATEKGTNSAISVGAGLRLEKFYIDAAYRFSMSSDEYKPYTTSFASQPLVNTDLQKNDVLLTLGFRF